MIIYKITNTANNKVYIGRTVGTLRKRRNKHFYVLRNHVRPNSHFQHAFDKYGEEAFKFEEIEKCSSIEMMREREIYWIAFYKSNDREFGYNQTEGGEGLAMISHEKRMEIGRKASSKLKGRKMPEWHKQKISKTNKGRVLTEEWKEKCSRSMKAKYEKGELPWLKPTYFSGEKHGMFGKTQTKEARVKISLAREGKTYEEIFGEEVAKELKEKQSKRSKGENNPFYKFLDAEQIKVLIDEGRTLEEIGLQLKASRATIGYKFKQKYEITVTQYKRNLKLNSGV